ncbi:hypothetical protein [Mesobacillus harenae]|uniref:hypothetical protein n=1 Tax=Mesobacillus harenae TaxID=2213203 RepID=UPI00158089B8|nr:hypothetical protein [Mesobacillus harenae]
MDELLKKLRYKAGPAVVLNAPKEYKLGIESEEELTEYEFVQVFVHNSEDVARWLPTALPLLTDNAVFWITYPKKSSKVKTDINRDVLWKMVEEASSYRAVSNVAVDEIWSAVRFRQKDKVKTKK